MTSDDVTDGCVLLIQPQPCVNSARHPSARRRLRGILESNITRRRNALARRFAAHAVCLFR